MPETTPPTQPTTGAAKPVPAKAAAAKPAPAKAPAAKPAPPAQPPASEPAAPRKPLGRRIAKGLLVGVLGLLALAGVVYVGRSALRPGPPPATEAQIATAARTLIQRDEWGIAHVHGPTDADAAFALAYAHAEDDWPTIQTVSAAAKGKLSLLQLSETAIGNDYWFAFAGVAEETERFYDKRLSEDVRAVLEGYAAGLNYYAALHPGEADGRILPLTGKDVAAGYLHKLPLMMRVGRAIGLLTGRTDPLKPGDALEGWTYSNEELFGPGGSNAHAVGPSRSADGKTRLNVNSHQPWTGPVAWHEIHVRSDEGWNASGATFPGAPMVKVGHNDHLGWSHTFNHPDLRDVYRLETDPENPLRYRLDGEWRELEVREATITVDVGLMNYTWRPRLLRSAHGPVVETDHGLYALRWPGIGDGRLLLAAEQWFRMNKATSFEEWKDAMRVHGIPLFNTVYADDRNIAYFYNAILPKRIEDADVEWRTILPGDRSDLIWDDYVAFDDLPSVVNPPSGWVQSCNSTPWQTTSGEGNPDPKRWPAAHGISNRMTNRAIRSHELFGADESITHDEFLAYKWDRGHSKNGPLFREAIDRLADYEPKNDAETKGLELLAAWDGACEEDSRTAPLAIMTWRPMWYAIVVERRPRFEMPEVHDTYPEAVAYLMEHFGRVDPRLGDVQRLRRGALDLELGGGPDVLNAIHAEEHPDGRLAGVAGDSFVMIVEWNDYGPRSWAVHNYGNVEREGSPHYADQAPLLVQRKLRRVLRTPEEIEKHLEAEYHPGEETTGP